MQRKRTDRNSANASPIQHKPGTTNAQIAQVLEQRQDEDNVKVARTQARRDPQPNPKPNPKQNQGSSTPMQHNSHNNSQAATLDSDGAASTNHNGSFASAVSGTEENAQSAAGHPAAGRTNSVDPDAPPSFAQVAAGSDPYRKMIDDVDVTAAPNSGVAFGTGAQRVLTLIPAKIKEHFPQIRDFDIRKLFKAAKHKYGEDLFIAKIPSHLQEFAGVNFAAAASLLSFHSKSYLRSVKSMWVRQGGYTTHGFNVQTELYITEPLGDDEPDHEGVTMDDVCKKIEIQCHTPENIGLVVNQEDVVIVKSSDGSVPAGGVLLPGSRFAKHKIYAVPLSVVLNDNKLTLGQKWECLPFTSTINGSGINKMVRFSFAFRKPGVENRMTPQIASDIAQELTAAAQRDGKNLCFFSIGYEILASSEFCPEGVNIINWAKGHKDLQGLLEKYDCRPTFPSNMPPPSKKSSARAPEGGAVVARTITNTGLRPVNPGEVALLVKGTCHMIRDADDKMLKVAFGTGDGCVGTAGAFFAHYISILENALPAVKNAIQKGLDKQVVKSGAVPCFSAGSFDIYLCPV